jgi:hypothetical protein
MIATGADLQEARSATPAVVAEVAGLETLGMGRIQCTPRADVDLEEIWFFIEGEI